MTGELPPLLVLENAAKSFGAVKALENASITLYGGEAHALLGENGAGKSTLVKILAGVHHPDSGRVLLDGAEVTLTGPSAAQAAGISIIYQEPTLFPDLTVAENIYIGRQPVRRGRTIDRARMNDDAAATFKKLGVVIDPRRPA
ncbi:MAG: transporter related protein, partial [Frankiales bacterium]|nr:transporter related protein [Frankiales bacterium]